MSTGTNAGFSGWFLISFHGMLFTYSFESARGCRSYQSSTSLSVSNTGNLRGFQMSKYTTINQAKWIFYCLRTTQARDWEGEHEGYPEMRPSSRLAAG